MHCDTLSEVGSLRENKGQLDLLRMKEQGYVLQNFAMFVDMALYEDPWGRTLELADCFRREMENNRDLVVQVRSWGEICRAREAGKLCALLTMEEGGVCRGDMSRLEKLYGLGVRMMTLTWNYENELGSPAAPGEQIYRGMDNRDLPGEGGNVSASGGLTEKGLEFAARMEELGIIIDVSHLSDKGFYQVAGFTKKPFVASHSNARTMCAHPRNLTDDMIRLIGERGGCIGLNYCGKFIAGEGEDLLEGLVRQARYITNIGGMEVLGLGSDFDGIPLHPYLTGTQDLPKLWEALRRGGFRERELEAVLWRNVFRVYRDVLQEG